MFEKNKDSIRRDNVQVLEKSIIAMKTILDNNQFEIENLQRNILALQQQADYYYYLSTNDTFQESSKYYRKTFKKLYDAIILKVYIRNLRLIKLKSRTLTLLRKIKSYSNRVEFLESL